MYKIFKIRTLFLIIGFGVISIFCFLTFFSGINQNTVSVAAEENEIRLPIIMYHGILNDTKYQGDYVISPVQFENDLKKLLSESYTTVTVSDLVDYVYKDKTLPQKPIMLTFDDGYYNNYLYAYPLLKKYGCKAVLSPIAYYSAYFSETDEKVSAAYFHCSWQQLSEMIQSGNVEVQNHSYNMHTEHGRLGLRRKQNEDNSAYEKLITDDIQTAQKIITDNLSVTPQAFVYPFGEFNDTTEKVIKRLSFRCSMICEEKVNVITKDKESLYKLGRFIRTDKMSSDEIFAKFE